MLEMKNDFFATYWFNSVTMATDCISQEGGIYCRDTLYWTVVILKGNIYNSVNSVPIKIVKHGTFNLISMIFKEFIHY